MKAKQYNFNYTYSERKYILSLKILNESKKEDKIFVELTKGHNCKTIAQKFNLSERTIQNRRRDITKKITLNIPELHKDKKSSSYVVYILIFPNDKVYIGQTQNPKQRWNNGMGYIQNKVMFEDIMTYGWNNITKKIVYDNLTFEQSLEKEKELIIHYKSNISSYGYNKEF